MLDRLTGMFAFCLVEHTSGWRVLARDRLGIKPLYLCDTRDVLPDAVIDRPKGYFPVPALSHLEGLVLDLVAEALHAPAARERAMFRPEIVDAMLAAPNEHRTNLDGSALWQLGLLELWLQTHLDA